VSNTSSVVYLLDVDNTLLDNDRVTVDMRRFLEVEVGPEKTRRYWEIFEDLRNELGYADYLGALQWDGRPRVGQWVVGYLGSPEMFLYLPCPMISALYLRNTHAGGDCQ